MSKIWLSFWSALIIIKGPNWWLRLWAWIWSSALIIFLWPRRARTIWRIGVWPILGMSTLDLFLTLWRRGSRMLFIICWMSMGLMRIWLSLSRRLPCFMSRSCMSSGWRILASLFNKIFWIIYKGNRERGWLGD